MFIRIIIIVYVIFNMFFEFERMFFEIKFTISNYKIKLKSKIIETLKCCKIWHQTKIFFDVVINVVIIRQLKNEMFEKKNENDENENWSEKNVKWREILELASKNRNIMKFYRFH